MGMVDEGSKLHSTPQCQDQTTHETWLLFDLETRDDNGSALHRGVPSHPYLERIDTSD
jgi:hypothetical protein